MNNSRAHKRHVFEQSVDLRIGEGSQPGSTVDISRGGVFVRTELLPAFGDRLVLLLELPGIPGTCSIPCVVRWVKPGEGVGLQFETLRAIEIWALNRLLSRSQEGRKT